MDDSMNSVHSISAMDISPVSSPTVGIHSFSSLSNQELILNAFQQHQERLASALLNESKMKQLEYHPISTNFVSDDRSLCLFSTSMINSESKSENIDDESNQIRQRITAESIPRVVEQTPMVQTSDKKTESPPSRRSHTTLVLTLIPVLFFVVYLTVQYLTVSTISSRSTNWQNASDYLTMNLFGQENGLRALKESMNEHKQFSIVLIEGPTGTGKSYVASSIQKFLPTTLISANTLLLLSERHWIESDHLLAYLSSHLVPSSFQLLIIDDLDLLSTMPQHYCQTLATALQSLNRNDTKTNLFILLLQTTATTNSKCQQIISNIILKRIQFDLLDREHIRRCIEKEAYTQNILPLFDKQQIDHMLDTIEYETGCKQIPTLVMMESKRIRIKTE